MKAAEIRKKYLEFFKERGHTIIPSASLIPENDSSVLFTTAGMHPLVPFLLGEKHPSGNLLASVQKCIRTGDIDEVGDDTHLTFFEMLGNWSLGDYWKEESIQWSWEFLTSPEWLGLAPEKLAITVFKGDADCPFDEESYNLWRSLGVADERIARLGKEDNWWPAGGKNPGPQGPDTEIFYWTANTQPPATYNPEDKNWVEIWNNVFMQYNRTPEGVYETLKQQNVDTGMGLERTTVALQGKKSVYETELFVPILDYIKLKSNNKYNERLARIIADHIRAAVFMIADSVIPSNTDRGYVLRRLIRRAVRYADLLGLTQGKETMKSDISTIAEMFIREYMSVYNNLASQANNILEEIEKEEKKFRQTLNKGLKEVEEMIEMYEKKNASAGQTQIENVYITGKDAFYFFSTFGFPFEMLIELVKEKALPINIENAKIEFEKEMTKHQDLSRTASAGMFKGGLADHSEIVVKYHTATHLLHQALKDVLGNHANQKGSNITAERLRFDFSHPDKMTPEQIKQVEDIVNSKIQADLPVHFEEMTVAEAKDRGAVGLFGEKYGEKVKVYFIGDYSKEICGGPHVEHTGTMGHFKITKEEACSAGVRRIKAVLE